MIYIAFYERDHKDWRRSQMAGRHGQDDAALGTRRTLDSSGDRLTRFGFAWFAHFAQTHGCALLVLDQERLSPEQEMVQDMMTMVHCFSSRLYGLRNNRKKLNEALKQDAENHAAGTSNQA